MKTYVPSADAIARQWYLVDADSKIAGRLAVKIARLLRGRNQPTYTPHVDTGHFVVVINAERVRFTGRKESLKLYKTFSGYRDGLRHFTVAEMRAKHPERIISHAVKGMLPKNNMSRSIIKRLKVYAGTQHPHGAQNPVAIDL